MRRTVGILMGLLVPLTAGCGYVFVEGPPSDQRTVGHFRCTESDLLPTLDLVWAAASGAAAIGAASTKDEWLDVSEAAIPLGASAAVWVSSGVVGLTKTAACRGSGDDHDQLRRALESIFGDTPANAAP